VYRKKGCSVGKWSGLSVGWPLVDVAGSDFTLNGYEPAKVSLFERGTGFRIYYLAFRIDHSPLNGRFYI
jgi:hypothetical protein